MSDDLIRRADVYKAVDDWLEGRVSNLNIKDIPSVDIPQSDDWEKYSDKLWKLAYERGKASVRPQGKWEIVGKNHPYKRCPFCKRVRAFTDTRFCDWCGARMKGADDD